LQDSELTGWLSAYSPTAHPAEKSIIQEKSIAKFAIMQS